MKKLWRNNSDRYFRDLKFNYLHLLGVIFFGEKCLDVGTNDTEKKIEKMFLTLKNQDNFIKAYNFISEELKNAANGNFQGDSYSKLRQFTVDTQTRIFKKKSQLLALFD